MTSLPLEGSSSQPQRSPRVSIPGWLLLLCLVVLGHFREPGRRGAGGMEMVCNQNAIFCRK